MAKFKIGDKISHKLYKEPGIVVEVCGQNSCRYKTLDGNGWNYGTSSNIEFLTEEEYEKHKLFYKLKHG